MTAFAVIVAGGTGERFGAREGKQLAEVAGRPVVAWSVAAFESCPEIDGIVVVAHPDRLEAYAEAVASPKVMAVVAGGGTRQQSVAAGLAELPADAGLVAVHDGARPLVTPTVIAEALRVLLEEPGVDGVVVGHPMFDTVKRVADGVVAETVDRTALWVAQTPQVFRTVVLRKAYRKAADDGFEGTDDASLVERAGGRVRMLAGPRENIKVTVPEDALVVDAVLKARGGGR